MSTRTKAKQSTLSDWSNVFEQSRIAQDKRNLEYAKEAKSALREAVKGLPKKTDEELFRLYDEALNGGYSNQYLMRVLVAWKGKIKKEMLFRMSFAADTNH